MRTQGIQWLRLRRREQATVALLKYSAFNHQGNTAAAYNGWNFSADFRTSVSLHAHIYNNTVKKITQTYRGL
jgi:hypothetical protein